MRNWNRSTWIKYGLAVVAAGVAAAVERALPETPVSLFPVFLAAILLCAWHGGVGLGLFAAGLSGIGVHWILVTQAQEEGWQFLPADGVRLGIFLVMGATVGLLSHLRREAELALRANQELFHRFMDASPAAAYVKDDQGHYLYINRRMQRLFKAASQNCVGKTDFDLFPRDLAQRFRADDVAVLSGRELSFEQAVVQEDGAHQWLAHKFSFQTASGQRFAAGILVEITQNKSRPAEATLHAVDIASVRAALEQSMGKVERGAAMTNDEARMTNVREDE